MGSDLDGVITKQAKVMNVTLPTRGPMFDEMHAALRRVKAAHPEQHWVHVAWALFLTIAIPSLILKLYTRPAVWSSSLLGFLLACYFLGVFHTRHHKGGVLFRISWLDKLTVPVYDFIENVWGIYPPAWRFHHQASHHVFTNFEDEHDVESPFPFFRLHPAQPVRWFHKFQVYYAPLIFTLTTFSYPFYNIGLGIPKYWLGIWFVLNWVIPCLTSGWWGVCQMAWVYAFTGIFLSYAFQVSHNHVKMGDRTASVATIDDWLKRQIEQSVSWGGYMATVIMGGLNYQIEHHIAPAEDTPLYYYFRPELQRICKKYGVNYTFEPSGFHAVYQYHRFLATMA